MPRHLIAKLKALGFKRSDYRHFLEISEANLDKTLRRIAQHEKDPAFTKEIAARSLAELADNVPIKTELFTEAFMGTRLAPIQDFVQLAGGHRMRTKTARKVAEGVEAHCLESGIYEINLAIVYVFARKTAGKGSKRMSNCVVEALANSELESSATDGLRVFAGVYREQGLLGDGKRFSTRTALKLANELHESFCRFFPPVATSVAIPFIRQLIWPRAVLKAIIEAVGDPESLDEFGLIQSGEEESLPQLTPCSY
ncbi:MAG: hypothetical protein ACJ74Z_19720 [Bryobacteraceae bacterium]